MRLAARELGGDGPPLVVLHGLYGSSRNWTTAGRALAARFHVVALDLRNHGESPHSPEMSYAALAGDVRETTHALGLSPMVLLGHSLGGKTAMRLACDAPDLVRHLLVADIAPKAYGVDPSPVEAMLGVRLEGVTRRGEIDAQMAERIADPGLRQFLLTNLERTDGGFAWRLPLGAIRDQLDVIGRSPVVEGDRYDGPVDFFAGGQSDYFAAGDLEAAWSYFPRARAHVFAHADHDVHIDARDELVAAVFEAVSR